MVFNCIKIASVGIFLFSCNGEKQKESTSKYLLEKSADYKGNSACEKVSNPVSQTEIEYKIKSSMNDIYGVIRVLDSLVKYNDYSKLEYYGHALDDKNNQIIIMLGDTSNHNIEQFKIIVLDSPYLKFEKAEKFQLE